MEKERFLETAGALLRVSAACSTSVGVGGGEERRLEFRDGAGDDLKLKDDDDSDEGEEQDLSGEYCMLLNHGLKACS
mgnify:FL=1